MAIYPCDFGGHRYPGAQQSVYVTVCRNGDTLTHKLRLCPKHVLEELGVIRNAMAGLEDDLQVSTVCESCGEKTQALVFAKVYLLHEEPLQFVADLCGGCQTLLADTLRIASGTPL